MTNDDAQKKIHDFRDLLVWQESHKLVLMVYKVTKTFPKSELFCLTSQMRRAAISVTSNIAEGFGRKSMKEKLQFYYVANGSLVELKNQLIISVDVGYTKHSEHESLMAQADTAHKLLLGLTRKTKSLSS